jgi:hypothetical protein
MGGGRDESDLKDKSATIEFEGDDRKVQNLAPSRFRDSRFLKPVWTFKISLFRQQLREEMSVLSQKASGRSVETNNGDLKDRVGRIGFERMIEKLRIRL